MDTDALLLKVREIRARLGYDRGNIPDISAAYTHLDGSIHVVAGDRADKSLLLGPGGRIAARLSDVLGHPVSIYSEDELLVRRHRLGLTKRRIGEMFHDLTDNQETVLDWVLRMVAHEMQYPEEESPIPEARDKSVGVALAFSGGVDSTATLAILKQASIHPTALTVELGEACISKIERDRISSNTAKLGVEHRFIPVTAEVPTAQDRVDGRQVHPCNGCHRVMYESLFKYLDQQDMDTVVTGEMLPSGRQSVVMREEILTVHLPAALSLTKYKTHAIAKDNGLEADSDSFGCGQVQAMHAFGWGMMAPSVFRVLRELDAGVLSTGQALAQIKSIVRPGSHVKHSRPRSSSE